ncbi:T9SS type A sorting domain-containing protein [Portibacter marinus]|uniref:T9SS type A sorting domain-containing protein n=1 Tax=Portibacter marinus TaxID=2898660 RepID=UPI001F18DCBC|nr:T9SS type A sorting domain-containing protein [Portibacter marinus]
MVISYIWTKFNSKDLEGRKYNLKYLPNGTYNMVIESDTKKAIHKLVVTNQSISISKDKNGVVFKPTIKKTENGIDLNQLALGRAVEVTISDSNGVFFTQNYKGITSINRRFDISKLPAGIYTVAVSGENQYDTYSFVK